MHECPKCQSDRVIKNGSAAGKPKKQCKQCGYQFTRTTPRGKPLKTKINAVLLYLSGISMNRIAFLLRVSAQTVLNWMGDENDSRNISVRFTAHRLSYGISNRNRQLESTISTVT